MTRDLLTMDFETHYSVDYSLSKMTAIEYVYDPRFEVILVSVKKNDEPTVWFSGSWEETVQWLSQYNINESLVCMHNGSEFDCLILGKMGFVPFRYICTLALARLKGLQDAAGGSLAALCKHFNLPPKGDEVVHAIGLRRADFSPEQLARYGAYCCNDTDRCYDLLCIMMPGVPAIEWVIMDILIKFLARPRLQLDRPLLEAYAEQLANRQEEILNELGVTKEELSSSAKFAELLQGAGIEPPMKPSPTQPERLIYAFAKGDAAMVELLAHDDEVVASLAAARLNVKSTIEATRTKRFLDTHALMGVMPMPQRYHGAHTGRGTGTMLLNMLNLSSRRRKPVLKQALLAPDGYVVVEGDSSQIEARTNSWNAEQDDLIRVWDNERSEMLFLLTMGASAEEFAALKRKYDVYRDFAADWIYHIPRDQVTPEMRMVAKSAVLGCGYMMGVERFREYVRIETGLHLDIGQAQAVIYAYRTRMNRIAGFWDVCKTVLAGMVHGEEFNFGRNGWLKSDPHDKTIRLPSGRFLFYRGLHVIAADEVARRAQAQSVQVVVA